MKSNIVYKLYINENLYVEIMYDGKSVRIVSNGNTPKNVVSVSMTRKKAIIKVGLIPKCTIDLESGIVHTELRVFPTSTVRNFSECINTKAEDEDFIRNQLEYQKKLKGNPIKNGTELHTHFMEILTGEEFLILILKHIDRIGLDYEDNLCRAYPLDRIDSKMLDYSEVASWVDKSEILSNRNLYNKLVSQLSLPVDRQVSFSKINEILNRRTALLDLVGYRKSEKTISNLDSYGNSLENTVRKLISDEKAEIYAEILIKSLETLKKQGIKYVELSFSNPNTIKKIYKKMRETTVEGIEFRFLLSENRMLEGNKFKECAKSLKKMINKGYVVGFDLMGMEQQITPFDYIKNSPDGNSLYDKLSQVVLTLNSFNNNNLICRLHAGEMSYGIPDIDGKSNPERTLEILDKIVNDNNIIVPPPTIRLGHALHISENDNYLSLLKKYKVIIEINASSNFALGNIKNLKNIPYRWYYENGIPMVIGTDGGGFYLTTPIDESKNAEIFGGRDVAEKIHETDESELGKRGL